MMVAAPLANIASCVSMARLRMVDQHRSHERMKRALIILGTLLLSSGISMRIDAAKAPTQRQPLVSRALKNDSSPALRDIQPLPLSPGPAIREIPLQRLRPRVRLGAQATEGEFNDPVVQDWHGEPSLPAPVQSFEGLSNANNQQVVGGQVVPPDT